MVGTSYGGVGEFLLQMRHTSRKLFYFKNVKNKNLFNNKINMQQISCKNSSH